MTRKNGLRAGFEPGIARAAAVLLTADSATLTDANIDPTLALNCAGFDTILVGAEIDGGVNPTLTVEPLFRDEEAPDGSRWKRLLVGARDGITPVASPAAEDTGALGANSDFAELRVFGAGKVFLRVKAVANAAGTTGWRVLVLGEKTRNVAGLLRG